MRRALRAALTRRAPSAICERIPRPRCVPVLGSLPALLAAGGAANLHRYVDARHRRLGPIFADQLGPVAAVFIADPTMMRAVFAQEGRHPVHALPDAWTHYNRLFGCARGLFFMEGGEWQHYRRIMNQCMLRTAEDDDTRRAIRIVAESLHLDAVPGEELQLEMMLYQWALDTIVAVLVGCECYTSIRHSFDLPSLAASIQAVFHTSAHLQFLPAAIAQEWRFRVWRDFEAAVRKALETASDLVHALLDAQPQDGLLRQMRMFNMTRADITRIVVDLVLAAGDTTAYTMQWALYLLARHPHVQRTMADDDASVRDVLRETLRMFPVAPFLTRIQTNEDVHLNAFTIPRGTMMVYSLCTVGRDASIFKDPHTFRPERWRPTARTSRMTAASLPFAMGARACIGKRIAELQMTVTLQELMRKYTVQMLDDQDDVKMQLKMVAVPATPIRLRFVRK